MFQSLHWSRVMFKRLRLRLQLRLRFSKSSRLRLRLRLQLFKFGDSDSDSDSSFSDLPDSDSDSSFSKRPDSTDSDSTALLRIIIIIFFPCSFANCLRFSWCRYFCRFLWFNNCIRRETSSGVLAKWLSHRNCWSALKKPRVNC